jgi:hypothetical protein
MRTMYEYRSRSASGGGSSSKGAAAAAAAGGGGGGSAGPAGGSAVPHEFICPITQELMKVKKRAF